MCVTLHPKTVDNSWTTCVFSEQHQGLTNMHMWQHTVTKLRAEQLVGDAIIGYMSVLTSVSKDKLHLNNIGTQLDSLLILWYNHDHL